MIANPANVFTPFDWQLAPLRDKSPVLVLDGGAGSGKSRIASEKLHAFMMKYPNAVGVGLRKTATDARKSVVEALKSAIGHNPNVEYREQAGRFDYWNGSRIYIGGMKDDKQRESLRSINGDGSVDIIWLEEANAFTRQDFHEVIARMRGTAADWRQVILTTNPGGPKHFIHTDLIIGGQASRYASLPSYNPTLPDSYMDSLNMLTGTMRDRLVLGEWTQAEGVVYSEFGRENIEEYEPDTERPIHIAFDDGYTDPRAILFIQRNGANVYVFDEIYESYKLGEQHVQAIIARCEANDWPVPELAIGSHEAVELHQHFRRANIKARHKVHKVVEGIKVVRRLILDGNGYRTLKVHPRCHNLINEITSDYQYPPEGKQRDGEKPLDGNDHACDALRYYCWMKERRVHD